MREPSIVKLRDGPLKFVENLLSAINNLKPLLHVAAGRHAAVTKQLLAARCNIDLQTIHGPLQISPYMTRKTS
jgi:hypothetical protein